MSHSVWGFESLQPVCPSDHSKTTYDWCGLNKSWDHYPSLKWFYFEIPDQNPVSPSVWLDTCWLRCCTGFCPVLLLCELFVSYPQNTCFLPVPAALGSVAHVAQFIHRADMRRKTKMLSVDSLHWWSWASIIGLSLRLLGLVPHENGPVKCSFELLRFFSVIRSHKDWKLKNEDLEHGTCFQVGHTGVYCLEHYSCGRMSSSVIALGWGDL